MTRFGHLIALTAVALIFGGFKGHHVMQENAPSTTEHVARMVGGEVAPQVTRLAWGEVEGEPVHLYTLRNTNGMMASIADYGATVTSVVVPDRDGNPVDVALGFDTLEEYVAKSPYFGCMAGRVGNRIAGGLFEIDGTSYSIATNNGPNHLHGGVKGFDKHVWDVVAKQDADATYLEFTRRSNDGEEGYPGTLDATVTYRLGNDNTLGIEVEATTDAPTPCNIVHHSYWNLGGHRSGTVLGESLELDAGRYTPTDATFIPTGELASVEGTPFNFRAPKLIGLDIEALPPGEEDPGGYDINFVVDGIPGKMRRVARARNQDTGIIMTIHADQPGVQFYTGNWLDDLAGKGGAVYPKFGGYCLETQLFPDSINHQGDPGWPEAILRPGAMYTHNMVHAFSVE